ncbi:hypothetical protein ABKV19_003379 [Rosa sericea]
MGVKDKKKNKELAQRNLEPVEKDKSSGPSEMRKRKREKKTMVIREKLFRSLLKITRPKRPMTRKRQRN